MKGDLLLLGLTGAAILIIPMAVTVGSGVVPQGVQAVSSTSQEPSSWVATPVSQSIPPATAVLSPIEEASSQPPQSQTQQQAQSQSESQQPPQSQGQSKSESQQPRKAGEYKLPVAAFKVLDRSSGKVQEVAVRDYLRGAIAAEMPASYHLEALKAQGVAALTYALFHVREQQLQPDPNLKGAHFSADPDKREGYMTEKDTKKFYGENKDYNWNKVCQAAEEAIQWVILQDGEPIAAAYHAISSGTTESAQNIWQRAMPCLEPVDSSWDILAKDYKSTATLTQAQVKEKLRGSNVTLLPNADTWFAVEQRSASGYVTQVRVGNSTMTGNQLRNLLGLRSSSFQIERQGKDFLFYVVGYGHGAGLSQNGADYMARQGKDFKQILEHYYTGGELARAR